MLKILLVLLAALPIAGGQERADFLILSDPNTFVIYNRFEQPLTLSEKKAFLPFSPIKIVKSEGFLGDEITRAFIGEFEEEACYLLRDSDKGFTGARKKQEYRTFKKCRIYGDTLVVKRDRAVLMSQKYPARGKRIFLKKGDEVVRLFDYQGTPYIKRLGGSPGFGWIGKAALRVLKKGARAKQTKKSGLEQYVVNRIVQRIAEVNRSYLKMFRYFNEKRGQEKYVPEWKMETMENRIRCTLRGPYAETGELDESTKALVSDLEGMVIGRSVSVTYNKGVLEISGE